MKITLYEEVALRNDYSVVFDTQEWFWGKDTPFAQYLKSRNSYEEEIENTYFSNDGSISISWPIYRTLPSGITYMKVEHDNETKYFFINSYEYRNEVIVLNYTLDVWHTYSKDMGIYSGVINRARYIPDGYRKTLPVTYQTNEALKFNGSESTFYLVAEFQVYRLSEEPQEGTDRFSYTSLISQRAFSLSSPGTTSYTPPTTIQSTTNFRFTIDEAIEAINNLTGHQGIKPLSNYDLGTGWGKGGYTSGAGEKLIDSYNLGLYSSQLSDYKPDELRYELVQIYAIPYQFSPQLMFNTAINAPAQATISMLHSVTVGDSSVEQFNFKEYQFTNITKNTSSVQYSIPANDKIVGIGLTSLFIPVGYNGIDRSVKLRSQANAFGFSLALEGETGISDISSHFAVPIPFTTPSGQERQIAALNRTAAKWQLGASAASLAMNALSLASPIGGAIKELGLAAASGYHLTQEGIPFLSATLGTAFEYQKMFNPLGTAVKQTAKDLFGGKGIGFLYQSTSLINSINRLQQPQSPSNPSDSSPIALLNAAYGLSTYTITPINQEEIDYMISRVGYETWIQSNDYRYSNTSSYLSGKYEPIQFATLQVHGTFPNNISSSLEQILLDGTLISYDPQIYNKL